MAGSRDVAEARLAEARLTEARLAEARLAGSGELRRRLSHLVTVPPSAALAPGAALRGVIAATPASSDSLLRAARLQQEQHDSRGARDAGGAGEEGGESILVSRRESLRRHHSNVYMPKHPTIFRMNSSVATVGPHQHHLHPVPHGAKSGVEPDAADALGLLPGAPERDEEQETAWGMKPHLWQSLRHGAWAGGVAGIIAETLMHPFDTISMRLKVQSVGAERKYKGLFGTARTLVAEEGVGALFNGVSATVLCSLPSSALYFGTYEWVKAFGLDQVERRSQGASSETVEFRQDAVHLVAGICSELASSVIVVPFEVIKSRMQLGSKDFKGAIHGLITVGRLEGFNGLYAGYRACLLQDCSFSGAQFMIYERIKRDVFFKGPGELVAPATPEDPGRWADARKTPGAPPPSQGEGEGEDEDEVNIFDIIDSVEETAEDLLAGAVAGGLAALVCNPLDVATARLMTQNYVSPDKKLYAGVVDCLGKIARNDGVRGLWSGSLARILSIAPLSAITFGIYEKMKACLHSLDL